MNSAAVLYSGGKDSTRAIEILRELGYSISCLITLISQNEASYMLHTSNIQLTELGSKALDIPIVYGQTKGSKEEELSDIKQTVLSALKKYNFETIGSGGLASTYQKARLEHIARDCGLGSNNPLWGVDQEAYMLDLVRDNYKFILTSVSAAGLDDRWLGKEMNEGSVVELIRLSSKFKFNVALEGGEGETLVLDCPIFRKGRINILEAKKEWNGYQGILKIEKAEIIEKTGC